MVKHKKKLPMASPNAGEALEAWRKDSSFYTPTYFVKISIFAKIDM
jgi:hypothetical protein